MTNNKTEDPTHSRNARTNSPLASRSPENSFIPVSRLFGDAQIWGEEKSVATHSAYMMLAKDSPQLMPVGHGWEKVTLIVDSGASDTVMPQGVCQGALLRHTSRVGIKYEVADGGEARNLGERVCEVKTDEASQQGMQMSFQVVDRLTKALLSVQKVCSQGHDVVFSNKKGNYILVGGDPSSKIPLRAAGGTYELDVWLRPSDNEGGQPEASFARPVNKR